MEKWYVIQTRPRWEKKVTTCLAQKGIQTYCPVKKIKRRWSDRMKTLEQPVFKACIFVRISSDQRTIVRLTEGVINFVYRNAKPALVRDKEMRILIKALDGVFEMGSNGKQTSQSSYQTYLASFNEWLITSMEKSNKFGTITIDS